MGSTLTTAAVERRASSRSWMLRSILRVSAYRFSAADERDRLGRLFLLDLRIGAAAFDEAFHLCILFGSAFAGW